MEEVTLFGVGKKEDVEKERFVWVGEDYQKTTGVLRPLTDIKTIRFFPLQTRCFILSA